MGVVWRSGSPFRTESAFGVAFVGGHATIGGGPASDERSRFGDQALERRLQFLGAGLAKVEDELAAMLDQAAGADKEDLPGPLPAGPGQVLTQRPPCRQRVPVERQDSAQPPGRSQKPPICLLQWRQQDRPERHIRLPLNTHTRRRLVLVGVLPVQQQARRRERLLFPVTALQRSTQNAWNSRLMAAHGEVHDQNLPLAPTGAISSGAMPLPSTGREFLP